MAKESVLTLTGVSKSFARADTNEVVDALSNIDLTVKSGEFVSIVGPSGCGKSTILRLVSGLLSPTIGTIELSGEKISGTSPNRGMAFQKPTLFPWLTVKRNVGFSMKMRGTYQENQHKIDDLLDMAGLGEFKDSYPAQLSGGMAQRVSLLRTMINEPEIFLLDEPLGALDAFTRMNMQDELLNMWQKKKNMMLMVTHDVEEAVYMGTRVIVMAPRPGRIIKDMAIDLPYPRNRSSQELTDYRNEILELLNYGKHEKN
ncbi:ABC transporter ATP-binding protein [Vagococcus acidifermentans]|uniref:ABC transporter ATP-binding protein n=1 Tax=Vagococcus acidifermentans TaxID=564710 RepID=A0A430AQM7_9ENTE|nr:ABC transporter ATP-binding protein [Vagococcus acidifermentans]RSU10431.1 ABC transporter ATP-binding protein [Vagococcus acidifermentans]